MEMRNVMCWVFGALHDMREEGFVDYGGFSLTPKGIAKFDQIKQEQSPSDKDLVTACAVLTAAMEDGRPGYNQKSTLLTALLVYRDHEGDIPLIVDGLRRMDNDACN